jgi:hypothetical protein
MTVAMEMIAQGLHLSPAELMRRGLQAYLEREMRAVQLDIDDLRDRYRVGTASELRAQIETGAVYSHPAWEECIEWQTPEAQLARLQRWSEELR